MVPASKSFFPFASLAAFCKISGSCSLVHYLSSISVKNPIHKAQLLSYMKLLNIPVGLLINFHEEKLTNGISRMLLPGAGQ